MRLLPVCHLLTLALGCALAGCDTTEPYARDGVWHPLGVNAANLSAMVADPADLNHGRGAALSEGDIGAAAVARLRADAVKRLPAASTARLRADETATQAGSGNAATPAAPIAASGAAQ